MAIIKTTVRYRKRAPLRKRKYGGVRRYRRKTVPNKVTLVKRLTTPILIQSQFSGGTDPSAIVVSDGGGMLQPSASFGAPNSGSIPGTCQFGGALSFQLNQCLQHQDLTNLFDRYKLTGVKLQFMFQQNTSDMAGGSLLPVMYGAYDFDDAIAPASKLSVQVKGYCKQRVLNANKNFSVYIKPRMLSQIEADGGVVANASVRPTWINSSSDDAIHVGYKFWVDNWLGVPTEAAHTLLTIQPTFYLALKDTQ